MGKREIRIYGVPEKQVNAVQTIAENLGTSVSDLLKPKIQEIIKENPQLLNNITL